MANIKNRENHFSLLLVCTVLLTCCCSSAIAYFEYFKLVLQWPSSFCSVPENKCKRLPLPTEFTIHGLWPENYTRELRNCKEPYSHITNNIFARKLDKIWPDLKKASQYLPNQGFWQEQWKRHGSCSYPVYSVNNYFLKAMVLNRKFNISKILSENGVDPGTHVDTHRVNETLKSATLGIPILSCPKDILTEIIICFDPRGDSVVPCPQPSPNKCPNNPVFFAI